jgi:hypothetical protein
MKSSEQIITEIERRIKVWQDSVVFKLPVSRGSKVDCDNRIARLQNLLNWIKD